VNTCQEVLQIFFEKSWDRKETFLQVNWHSTFVFVMAWHAMSYNMSSSNITCHVMHASHVMISHAHMHITFMACICSATLHHDMHHTYFPTAISLKKVTPCEENCTLWPLLLSCYTKLGKAELSGHDVQQQCITLYVMRMLFCHDKHWCYPCSPCHSHITSITSLRYTITFFPCYTSMLPIL
jgi:hypothetical protein